MTAPKRPWLRILQWLVVSEVCGRQSSWISNIYGKPQAQNYAKQVNSMISYFRELVYNMSINIHYLHSHLNRFPNDSGDMKEEQGERFHRYVKIM